MFSNALYTQADQDSPCINDNECDDESICQTAHANATCSDTPGSYHCNCPAGFEMNENDLCVDIEECITRNIDCGHGTCSDTEGT